MHAGFVGRLVPAKVVVAVGEVDILLMEDGGPLKGGSYAIESVGCHNDEVSAHIPWSF